MTPDGGAQHYFSPKPASEHNRREILYSVGSRQLRLLTDTGVFSRNEVDPGSKLLVAAVSAPASGAILDLGCGYGPIGLAFAALQPGCQVYLTDINERAVALAVENAVRNNIGNVTVYQGDGLASLPDASYNLIVTNPPIRAGRSTLLMLFTAALGRLAPHGRLAFVVRTHQGAKTLAREVGRLGAEVTEVAKEAGYRVYVARRAGEVVQ